MSVGRQGAPGQAGSGAGRHIRVEMLGGLSASAGGRPLLETSGRVPAAWRLLCCLLLHQGAAAQPSCAGADLWQGEEAGPEAPAKAAQALQAAFAEAGVPDGPVLLTVEGAPVLNPELDIWCDVAAFETLAAQALEQGEGWLAEAEEALALYRGDLLPGLSAVPFVVQRAAECRGLYRRLVQAVCRALEDAGDNSRLLQTATEAARLDPLEDSHYRYVFSALYGMEMYRAIIPAYHKAARLFAEELGTGLSSQARIYYEQARDRVDLLEQDMMLIREDLREATLAGLDEGPLYCNYEVFKYLYQMVARSSERGGRQVMIVLMSLIPGEGTPPKAVPAAMRRLRQGMLGGLLRRSDAVARYSKNQFIIMLSVDKAASAARVVARIESRCRPALEAEGIRLAMTSAEPESPL